MLIARDQDGPVASGRVPDGGENPGEYADDSAKTGEQQRLGKELRGHVATCGLADRTQAAIYGLHQPLVRLDDALESHGSPDLALRRA